MRTLRHRQRGMTVISMIIIFAMVVGYFLLALRLFPVYMENFKVSSALNSLRTDPSVQGKTPIEIVETFMKRIKVDDVETVEKSDVTVERTATGYGVGVDYTVHKDLVGNVSISVHFQKEVEIEAKR